MCFVFDGLPLQVCLDGQLTTEKELDTVEVLKAIQKARDVKEKKASSITKVHLNPQWGVACVFTSSGPTAVLLLYEETRLFAAAS